ncbi:hypothetical protein DDJ72_04100 [Mycobacteroides abscessus]|uniref:type IV toxin-antitoxin system AbiEi family antitoxin domain-containing protein n=1 Tax=Mycobacteroides abscessus TaxID=36809 RepID=UPI000D3E1213|nr:type IV toxin-antitoxin system AbiEi family antitoxin domain-containing protein [Mycobacteroides abscessus]PVA58083.1 hypothetical protein DDJ72_04100 [Mycobacteroides abscessus]
MTDFEPIEWAMQQTGMTVAEVVAIILTSAPAKAKAKGPTQLERLIEFVDGEFDTRAADVVARGICASTTRASILLSDAANSGLIDRIAHGVYAPKGTAALNDGA